MFRRPKLPTSKLKNGTGRFWPGCVLDRGIKHPKYLNEMCYFLARVSSDESKMGAWQKGGLKEMQEKQAICWKLILKTAVAMSWRGKKRQVIILRFLQYPSINGSSSRVNNMPLLKENQERNEWRWRNPQLMAVSITGQRKIYLPMTKYRWGQPESYTLVGLTRGLVDCHNHVDTKYCKPFIIQSCHIHTIIT